MRYPGAFIAQFQPSSAPVQQLASDEDDIEIAELLMLDEPKKKRKKQLPTKLPTTNVDFFTDYSDATKNITKQLENKGLDAFK